MTSEDLLEIQQASKRNNPNARITGFLIRLGEFFFQALEGPAASVDRIFYERIRQDPRHTDICVLRVESRVTQRQFSGWRMELLDLDADVHRELPAALRSLLEALVQSNVTLARYTQPSILQMLQEGQNPSRLRPRMRKVTVLFSDIIGFSILAERLPPRRLLGLVNAHVDICADAVGRNGGQINKLLGDGVLAYFPGPHTDGALHAVMGLLEGMRKQREAAASGSDGRVLYCGVGLAFGAVYEGNIGGEAKQDFTILGNTVNLASRLESLTRKLSVRLVISRAVVANAREDWPFVSLGVPRLKGFARAGRAYTLGNLTELNVARVYDRIRRAVRPVRSGSG
jgi:class 3 adenylate cyclase